MTQRIFDVENEKDMADLWDILPDNAVCINFINKDIIHIGFKDDETLTTLFKINWHDKTEITRPIQEATEKDIGKICKFWNDNIEDCRIAIFICILDKFNYQFNFCDDTDTYWKHCRRLTKQEIEEIC